MTPWHASIIRVTHVRWIVATPELRTPSRVFTSNRESAPLDSFGYVAMWADGGDQAITGIKASRERILKSVATILRTLDPAAE
jgi:hypothetical protein